MMQISNQCLTNDLIGVIFRLIQGPENPNSTKSNIPFHLFPVCFRLNKLWNNIICLEERYNEFIKVINDRLASVTIHKKIDLFGYGSHLQACLLPLISTKAGDKCRDLNSSCYPERLFHPVTKSIEREQYFFKVTAKYNHDNNKEIIVHLFKSKDKWKATCLLEPLRVKFTNILLDGMRENDVAAEDRLLTNLKTLYLTAAFSCKKGTLILATPGIKNNSNDSESESEDPVTTCLAKRVL